MINVRAAEQNDVPEIHQFICDLAEYEKALHEVKCSIESLRDSLFSEDSVAQALMIEDGDVAPAVATGIADSGIDMVMGIGGAPEGVLTAAAVRCSVGSCRDD